MTSSRRLSQRISEGDGISVVVVVDSAAAAAAAEAGGADGVALRSPALEIAEATELPVLVRGEPGAAVDAGADVCIIPADDDEALVELYEEATGLGLEPVVAVANDEELELALEHVDPEIFLLYDEDGRSTLEHVLELLPSVPAGKLAIAELAHAGRDEVAELERAGVDAVLVPLGSDVAGLVGGPPPEV